MGLGCVSVAGENKICIYVKIHESIYLSTFPYIYMYIFIHIYLQVSTFICLSSEQRREQKDHV